MSTFPTESEIEANVLASRLLGQLHQIEIFSDVLVRCTACGAKWLCDAEGGKLKLTEATEGNGSCEAEVLRAISTAGMYSELGRRRVAKRKAPGRNGGRPRGAKGTRRQVVVAAGETEVQL